MSHKEQAFAEVAKRAEFFGTYLERYKTEQQNETETRVKFIDHFFKALGWDMDNSKCLPPHLEEVVREETIDINRDNNNNASEPHNATPATRGRTDYTFRDAKGKPLFYLEAKKPSVDILLGNAEALQIRSYSWNTGLPIGVLTDFEEFAVYDGTIPTKPNDLAATARADYFTYKEYTDQAKFNYIYDRFAQPNVTKQSLSHYQEKYTDKNNFRKGSKTVDDAFLESLEDWRKTLAVHIVMYNDQALFSLDEINYFVQITLNRILFLRNCEDRNIEPYGALSSCVVKNKKDETYTNFLTLCERADNRYNAGLFDLSRYNRIAYRMKIDNANLGSIIQNTYYPASPYRFELISPDILGTAYERFLGKTIALAPKTNAQGKPLGITLNGVFVPSQTATVDLKPEVRKAGGVYYTPQYIVHYIVQHTVGALLEARTPTQVAALTFCDPACGSGSFLIGVYQYLIDWHTNYYLENPQKTQPNRPDPLHNGRLTVAERKRILTNNIYGVDIDAQAVEVTKLSLLMLCLADTDGTHAAAANHILPNIDANIQCGNSLIDTQFSWQKQFAHVFNKGGFDAVVGNPPYGASYEDDTKRTLADIYSLPMPIADTYLMFMKLAYSIAKQNADISYIIPSTWLYMSQYTIFRKDILERKEISEVMLFKKPVFESATVETCIIIFKNTKPKNNFIFNYKEIKDEPKNIEFTLNSIKQIDIFDETEASMIVASLDNKNLFEKIKNNNVEMKAVTTIVCGLTPYRLGKGKPTQSKTIVENRSYDADFKKDKTYRQYLMGRDFNRYNWCLEKERWISYGDWLAEPRYKAPFNEPQKIIMRQTSDKLIAQLDEHQFLSLKNVHNIKINDKSLSYKYLLAVLNSKLLNWWYQKLIPEQGRVFAEVKVVNLEKLPIKTIKTAKEVKTHDRIVQLVTAILAAKAAGKTTEAAEAEIDDLVYGLYGLTAAEVAVIAGAD